MILLVARDDQGLSLGMLMRVNYTHLYALFKPYPCHLFDKISTLYLPLIANVQSIANLFVMILFCRFGHGNHWKSGLNGRK